MILSYWDITFLLTLNLKYAILEVGSERGSFTRNLPQVVAKVASCDLNKGGPQDEGERIRSWSRYEER